MSLALRHKLRNNPRKNAKKSKDTQIILLDEPSLDEAHFQNSKLCNLSSWMNKFSVEDFQDAYSKIIHRVYLNREGIFKEVTTKNQFRRRLSEFFRNDQSCSKILSHLSRRNRKKTTIRIASCVFSLEPIGLAILDEKYVAAYIQGDQIFSVQNDSKQKRFRVFASKEEAALSFWYANKRDSESGTLHTRHCEVFFEKLPNNSTSSIHYLVKPRPTRGKNILDLVKMGTLPIEYAKLLSNYVNKASYGMLVSGAPLDGKTTVISALITALSSDRTPLVIGNMSEIRNTHARLHTLAPVELENHYKAGTMKELATALYRSGINIAFMDTTSTASLMLSLLLSRNYEIPSIVSIAQIPNNGSLTELLYTLNERTGIPIEIDAAGFCEAFPLILRLSDKDNHIQVLGVQHDSTSILVRGIENPEQSIQASMSTC